MWVSGVQQVAAEVTSDVRAGLGWKSRVERDLVAATFSALKDTLLGRLARVLVAPFKARMVH